MIYHSNNKKFVERKKRILKLDRALKKLFPNAKIELNYATPWELLVAVQLSAKCTDRMVNKITEKLFVKYKKLDAYVRAGKTQNGIATFEQDIKSSGFYRAKTKNILAAAALIQKSPPDDGFAGRVPKKIDELLKLPGVARKTATVVLAE